MAKDKGARLVIHVIIEFHLH